MHFRAYEWDHDFDEIKDWIRDKRTHALWSSNLIGFPVEREEFHGFVRGFGEQFGDKPFVAMNDEGKIIGFFCISINHDTNEGMFKLVTIDPEQQGKGYGKTMLRLAAKEVFARTNVDLIHLNVFRENIWAKRCYDHIGFVIRETFENFFRYNDEVWARYNMILRRETVSGE